MCASAVKGGAHAATGVAAIFALFADVLATRLRLAGDAADHGADVRMRAANAACGIAAILAGRTGERTTRFAGRRIDIAGFLSARHAQRRAAIATGVAAVGPRFADCCPAFLPTAEPIRADRSPGDTETATIRAAITALLAKHGGAGIGGHRLLDADSTAVRAAVRRVTGVAWIVDAEVPARAGPSDQPTARPFPAPSALIA